MAASLPSTPDELHFVADALWADPRFPGARLEFVRAHASPHRVLELDEWRLVTHGEGPSPWNLPRAGHSTGYALLLGLGARPWLGAGPPGELARTLLLPARLVSAAADVLALLALTLLVARRLGRRVALAAASWYALTPVLVVGGAQARPDSLLGVTALGAALLLCRSEGAGAAALAGALLGLTCACKQTGFLLLPAVLLAVDWRTADEARRGRQAALVAAVAALVWVTAVDPSSALGVANQPGLPETWIPADPGAALAALLHPERWWLLGEIGPPSVSLPVTTRLHRHLGPATLGLAAGAWVLAFAVRPRAAAALAAGMAPLLVLTNVGTCTYRLSPIAGLFAAGVGIGLCSMRRASRPARHLAAALAVLVTSWSAQRLERAWTCRASLRAAGAALEAGDVVSAREELHAALRVAPDDLSTLALLGALERSSGNTAQAEQLLDRAADALDPYFHVAEELPVGVFEELVRRRGRR